VSKAVLISAIPPVMVRSEKNPSGTPIEVFDGFRAALAINRSQFYLDVASGPFYNFDRPGVKPINSFPVSATAGVARKPNRPATRTTFDTNFAGPITLS
jgi:hypothetical protein